MILEKSVVATERYFFSCASQIIITWRVGPSVASAQCSRAATTVNGGPARPSHTRPCFVNAIVTGASVSIAAARSSIAAPSAPTTFASRGPPSEHPHTTIAAKKSTVFTRQGWRAERKPATDDTERACSIPRTRGASTGVAIRTAPLCRLLGPMALATLVPTTRRTPSTGEPIARLPYAAVLRSVLFSVAKHCPSTHPTFSAANVVPPLIVPHLKVVHLLSTAAPSSSSTHLLLFLLQAARRSSGWRRRGIHPSFLLDRA